MSLWLITCLISYFKCLQNIHTSKKKKYLLTVSFFNPRKLWITTCIWDETSTTILPSNQFRKSELESWTLSSTFEWKGSNWHLFLEKFGFTMGSVTPLITGLEHTWAYSPPCTGYLGTFKTCIPSSTNSLFHGTWYCANICWSTGEELYFVWHFLNISLLFLALVF